MFILKEFINNINTLLYIIISIIMFIPKEDTEWYDGGYDGEISDGEISDGEISDTEDLYFSDDDDDYGKKNIFLGFSSRRSTA